MARDRIDKISDYYRNYGILTLLFGRFVPFGVRNLLFLTAGLGQMNAVKFAIVDFLACTVSVIVYFSVYHHYGQKNRINYPGTECRDLHFCAVDWRLYLL
ncbi:DedA family protein [Methylocucumis oryzae]|uniref:DedA family protein n=1 Tax=Methylocucumis oryzae TaxID=1632867 RepID=UPI001EF9EE76|nr:VTT domain-containing protein [Methylocucumis oryzae]